MQGIEDLLARHETKKAEIALAKYLRNDLSQQDRANGLIYRARVRLRSGRPDDAIHDLNTARELAQDNFETPETLELLGDVHLARFEMASVGFADRADTDRAQHYYQRVLDEYPAYMNRGWIYYQMGRLALADNAVERAEARFQQALLTPSHVRALTAYCYERLGFIAFYEQRDLDAALGFLSKAIDTYPASEKQSWLVQVQLLRSRVLHERREYRAALAAAETAVNIAASSGSDNRLSLAEALLTVGEMLMNFPGRERDAISHLQQFLQISKRPLGVDVTWSRVHEMLGDAYFKLMQYELAAEAYEAALQYNPYHPWEISLYYRIARSYYHQNNYTGTVTAIKQLMSTAENEGEPIHDYRIYDILGNAQFALGQYTEAEASYRAALELAPANAEGLEKIRKYYQFAQELS